MKSITDRVAKNVLRYESNIFGIEYRRFMMIIFALIISALIFRLNLYLSVVFLLISSAFLIIKVKGEVLGNVVLSWFRRHISGTEGILINTYELFEVNGCILSLYGNTVVGIVEIDPVQSHTAPSNDLNATDNSLRLILNNLECSVEFLSIPHVPDPAPLLPMLNGELERDYTELLKYSFAGVYYLRNYMVLKYPVTAKGFHETATHVIDGMEKLRRDLSLSGFVVRKIDSRTVFANIFSNMV